MSGPIFPHDCKACVYLATITAGGGWRDVVDLYYHPGSPNTTETGTVISRYGDDGDFSSGLSLARPDRVAALYCAAQLAIQRGLLTQDQLNRATERSHNEYIK